MFFCALPTEAWTVELLHPKTLTFNHMANNMPSFPRESQSLSLALLSLSLSLALSRCRSARDKKIFSGS